MTGHEASVPPGMNAIKYLRRLSPLAVTFVALAAVLALTPSAHAQSSQAGQLEAVGLAPGYSAKAIAPNFVSLEPTNPADFTQRWERVKVSTDTFRFTRFGFLNCIRVPAGLASSQIAAVERGNCSGTLAQWRRVGIAGAGDLYVNVATGHYLSPPICLFTCDNRVLALDKGTAEFGLGLPLLRWQFNLV